MLSVAMTVYNQAQYVLVAIRSVAAQTHQDWELVVVDDCSTDNSLKVIEEYKTKSDFPGRIKIITHKENMGYGYSLKEAIESSSGALVMTLDSDDVLAKKGVFTICESVHKENPDVSMTYSNYMGCYEDLKPKCAVITRQIEEGESYLKRGGAFSKDGALGDEMRVNLKISHLKVFKRSYYDKTEGLNPNLRKTVDKDLVFKLEEVGRLKHIDEILMYYRRHSNTLAAVFGRSSLEFRKVIEKARQGIYREAIKRRKWDEVER